MKRQPRIVNLTNRDERFYKMLGRFLCRREIVKEIGAPVWDDDGKTWYVATIGRAVAGFAATRRDKEVTVLCSAYVVPRYRLLGIYSDLLSARLKAIKGAVRATATAASKVALQKAGLKINGRKGRYFQMEGEKQ